MARSWSAAAAAAATPALATNSGRGASSGSASAGTGSTRRRAEWGGVLVGDRLWFEDGERLSPGGDVVVGLDPVVVAHEATRLVVRVEEPFGMDAVRVGMPAAAIELSHGRPEFR